VYLCFRGQIIIFFKYPASSLNRLILWIQSYRPLIESRLKSANFVYISPLKLA